MPSLNIKGRSFSIDSNTGFFAYTDNSQLFTDYAKPNLPKNANEAQKAADSFMLRANALIQKEPFFVKQSFPLLFTNLKPVTTRSILHPQKRIIDHWEVTYKGWIKPSDNEKSVQVTDSIVEFKIGNAGQVIGCLYSWLPIKDSENFERSLRANQTQGCIYFIDTVKKALLPYFITQEE